MADILGAGAAFLGGTSGGSANTQTLSYIYPSGYAKQVGAPVSFVAGFTNSGAATLNVLGSGAVAIRRGTPAGPVALSGGEIFAGQAYVVMFDGTYYVLLNPSFNPVLGPGSAVSGHVAVFSGTSGALLADGGSLSGRVGQIVTFETGAVATGTAVIPLDDTIPQITEGDQYMSLAITPLDAGSTLVIQIAAFATHSAASIISALFRDAVANALASGSTSPVSAGISVPIPLTHSMLAGGTSLITFRFRMGGSGAGTVTFNGTGGVRTFGGTMASGMIITEYLP